MSKKIIFILGLSLLLVACGTTENDVDKQSSNEVSESEGAVQNSDGSEHSSNGKEEEGSSTESFYVDAAQTMIPWVSEEILEMTDTSYTFISENINLFPAKTEEDIEEAKDKTNSEITIRNLNKNATPYLEEVLTFEGWVIMVEEETLDNGEVMSLTYVMDDEEYVYVVLMFKTTGDILEDDVVRFWGAPVGAYSYDDESGGFTNAQLFVGSHMEKTQ